MAAVVKHGPGFDDLVTELATTHPGIREAIAAFVDALQLAGADLPAQTRRPDQRCLGKSPICRYLLSNLGITDNVHVDGRLVTMTR